MTPLPTRTLGRTGLEVSLLGFGAMELRETSHRNPRPLQPGQADRVLNAVLDAGVTFVDTSIDYGASEESIGRAIAHRRDEYVLASKCGCPLNASEMVDVPAGPLPHTFTRENIVAGVEQSLRLLRTDHLDLLQFHQSPARTTLEAEDAIETVVRLRDQGKIRFIGASSTIPNVADHIDMGVFDTFQLPYSALERDYEAIIDRAAANGAGIIVRGGVARGEPGEGNGPERLWSRWKAAAMDELLDGMGRTEFLLRFTITHPHVSTTIVGTASTEHLDRNLRAVMAGPLPRATYEDAKARLARAGSAPAPT